MWDRTTAKPPLGERNASARRSPLPKVEKELGSPGKAHFPLPLADSTRIEITAKRFFEAIELGPRSTGISPVIDKGKRRLRFDVRQAGKWVVSMDGSEHLFILAEAPSTVPSDSISVLDHGADPSGKTLSTTAIQSAIDKTPAGSTVRIPPGHYLSGSLFIRSGVNLFLEAGALLQASGNPELFEPVQNAFIVIEDVADVTLKGNGTIDASGAFLRHLTNEGGRLLAIRDSRNVVVEGLILRNPRSWHTHIVRSERVTIRNVKVLTDRYVFNTDGINPDSSRHVLIEDTLFYCGDDAVAVKSTNRNGRFEDVFDITIRNNIMLTKKSALKVGTETHATHMRDILFENNQVIESDRGMSLYARDGTYMHDIRFVGNRFERPYPDHKRRLIDFQITKRHGLSRISNILIKDNIADVRWLLPPRIRGFSGEHDISNVVFDNLVYAGKHCLSAEDCDIDAGTHTKAITFK